jgi:hypothetical protein
MNPEDVGRILDEIGERIGPAGSHVFELAIRQAIIDGSASLVAGVILIVVAVWAFRRARTAIYRKPEPDPNRGTYYSSTDKMDEYFPMGGVAAATGIVFILGIWTVYDGVTSLLNPEYAAIRDLLSRLVPQ